MDLYKKQNRHFYVQTLDDLRRSSTAELIINTESDSIMLAWSSLTILAERGLPVRGTQCEWEGACYPFICEPVVNKPLLENIPQKE